MIGFERVAEATNDKKEKKRRRRGEKKKRSRREGNVPQLAGWYGQWAKIGVGWSCRGARQRVGKKGGRSDESDQFTRLRLGKHSYERPA